MRQGLGTAPHIQSVSKEERTLHTERARGHRAYFLYALKYGFTTYNALAVTAVAVLPHLIGADSPPQLDSLLAHARATITCATLGIACVFNAALFIDRTSFPRIAARLGLTLPVFHLANLVVHVLPCMLVVTWSVAVPIKLAHGALAAVLHLRWGAWASSGSMLLDEIYVPLPRATWARLWTIAVAAECLLVPLAWPWPPADYMTL